MIKPLANKISCLLTDVIRLTLASCDYRDCNEICQDNLMEVAKESNSFFNNKIYGRIWNNLYKICNEIGEQTSPFYLDSS